MWILQKKIYSSTVWFKIATILHRRKDIWCERFHVHYCQDRSSMYICDMHAHAHTYQPTRKVTFISHRFLHKCSSLLHFTNKISVRCKSSVAPARMQLFIRTIPIVCLGSFIFFSSNVKKKKFRYLNYCYFKWLLDILTFADSSRQNKHKLYRNER